MPNPIGFDEYDDPDQMDFAQLLVMDPGHRETAEGADIALAASSPDDKSAAYQQDLLIAREQLRRYILTHPIGYEFQAVDFGWWLDSQREQPSDDFDRRALGGFFIALVNHGVIEEAGYRPNGGNKARNNHSTPRKVYRIASHETTRLGWLEQPTPPQEAEHV